MSDLMNGVALLVVAFGATIVAIVSKASKNPMGRSFFSSIGKLEALAISLAVVALLLGAAKEINDHRRKLIAAEKERQLLVEKGGDIRIDHAWNRHRNWLAPGVSLERKPSEYFAEHIYVTFQDDWTAFRFADDMNWRRLMWANDFPHSDSTWPWSQDLLAEQTVQLTSRADQGHPLRTTWCRCTTSTSAGSHSSQEPDAPARRRGRRAAPGGTLIDGAAEARGGGMRRGRPSDRGRPVRPGSPSPWPAWLR